MVRSSLAKVEDSLVYTTAVLSIKISADFTSRLTGFVSLIGYYPIKLTSKKFEVFEVYILNYLASGD
jgi:hypothetical protein